jgi:hypothetical protein
VALLSSAPPVEEGRGGWFEQSTRRRHRLHDRRRCAETPGRFAGLAERPRVFGDDTMLAARPQLGHRDELVSSRNAISVSVAQRRDVV